MKYQICVQAFELTGVKVQAMVIGTGESAAAEATEEIDTRPSLPWRGLLLARFKIGWPGLTAALR